MLKIKHFNPAEKGHDEQFNSFMETHSPRNGKNSPGIVLNQNGLYVFYEDGEPCSAEEQIAELTESIRGKRYEIFQSEPFLRLKKQETEKFRQLLLDAKQLATYGDTPKEQYDNKRNLKEEIKNLEQKIAENEAWILTTEANQTIAREQIKYTQEVIKDIREGKWSAI